MPQYIYHNEKGRHYYGHYNSTENDILYDVKFDPTTMQLIPAVATTASRKRRMNEAIKDVFRHGEQMTVSKSWKQYQEHMNAVMDGIEQEQVLKRTGGGNRHDDGSARKSALRKLEATSMEIKDESNVGWYASKHDKQIFQVLQYLQQAFF